MVKIVSGGQTGSDRAGLDVAILHKIPHGGWCPKGRVAEDGILDQRYMLTETDSTDVSVRTMKNIEDSDGTVIFVPSIPLPGTIKDGTILTIQHAEALGKPILLIDISKNKNTLIEEFTLWYTKHSIKILNIAGPRETNCKGIYAKTFELFNLMVQRVEKEEKNDKLSSANLISKFGNYHNKRKTTASHNNLNFKLDLTLNGIKSNALKILKMCPS